MNGVPPGDYTMFAWEFRVSVKISKPRIVGQFESNEETSPPEDFVQKVTFQKRDCPPGLGGQHDPRSCGGRLIKSIVGIRSTAPAPIH
jgi:hypothetical protein